MEDWETFFAEKSRRRAGEERRARSRRRLTKYVAVALIGALVAAGLVVLDGRGITLP